MRCAAKIASILVLIAPIPGAFASSPERCELHLTTALLSDSDEPYQKPMRELVEAIGPGAEMRLSWEPEEGLWGDLFKSEPGDFPMVAPNIFGRWNTHFTLSAQDTVYDFYLRRDEAGNMILYYEGAFESPQSRQEVLAIYTALAVAPYVHALQIRLAPLPALKAKLKSLREKGADETAYIKRLRLPAVRFMAENFGFPIGKVYSSGAEVRVNYVLPERRF